MEITPEQYLAPEAIQDGEAFGDIEAREASQINQTAQGLGRRARLEHEMRGIADEDVDAGSFDTRNADGEALLNQLIAQAANATDPIERARHNRKAEEVAAKLVQLQQGKPVEFEEPEESSTFEELQNSGNDVRGVLDRAAEDFTDETIDALNPILKGDDKALAKDVFTFVKQYQEKPEWFIHPDDITPLDQALVQEIAEQHGPLVAQALEVTTLALQNGKITPTEMLQTLLKRPDVKKSVVTLLREGKIVIPFA